jgi:hypothetical protein
MTYRCNGLIVSLICIQIYWLVVAVIWGILRLIAIRTSVPNDVLLEEESWTMGQVMPIVLIGLPLMAATEYFFQRMLASRSPLTAVYSCVQGKCVWS